MSRRTCSRRCFLRGAGGYALTIPTLPSLLGRAYAQDTPQPSLRFMCITSQFGRDQDFWIDHPGMQPSDDGQYQYGVLSDLEGDISPIFGAAYDPALRKKIAIASGLDIMGWTNGHDEGIVLTGGSSGAGDLNSFGESLDCVLEASDKFYPELPMLGALRVNNRVSMTSRFAHAQRLPSLREPMDIYRQLYDPEGLAAAAGRNTSLARVTHLVFEDYKRTISSRRIGQQDRVRLDNYIDIISDIEQKIGRVPIVSCDSVSADLLAPQPGTAELLQDLFFDLEVAALACDITRIVTHGIYHVESDINQILGPDYHGAAHNHSQVVSGGRRFVDYNRWTMERVASLLRKLDAVTDSDGNTLLDNTLVLFSSSDARGSHTHQDMPIVLAGARGLVRTDRYVDYRRGSQPARNGTPTVVGVPYNNLLVSIFHCFGLGADDYTLFPERNQIGFGEYSDGLRYIEDYYRPMVAASERNKRLPYLFL